MRGFRKMPDYLEFALKLIGSVVAGAYGIYATVTDFHVEKNGKRILSRGGYLGIALLLVSTFLGISSDTSKQIEEVREKRKSDADRVELLKHEKDVSEALTTAGKNIADQVEKSTKMTESLKNTSDSIQQNLKTTASALAAARDAADPIPRDFELNVAIRINRDQPIVMPWWTRTGDALNDQRNKSLPQSSVFVWPKDREYPDAKAAGEQDLFSLLNFYADIWIERPQPDDDHDYQLGTNLRCDIQNIYRKNNDGPQTEASLGFRYPDGAFVADCENPTAKWNVIGSDFDGNSALSGSKVLVEISAGANIYDTSRKVDLTAVKMGLIQARFIDSRRRIFMMDHFREETCKYPAPDTRCFVTTIPQGRRFIR
jgi:hypothetical protein